MVIGLKFDCFRHHNSSESSAGAVVFFWRFEKYRTAGTAVSRTQNEVSKDLAELNWGVILNTYVLSEDHQDLGPF